MGAARSQGSPDGALLRESGNRAPHKVAFAQASCSLCYRTPPELRAAALACMQVGKKGAARD